MACVVIAIDPSLRGGAEGTSPHGQANVDPATERRRSSLANACRLLEKVGEKSPMASDMVKRLVGVLRRHRVHGVEQGGSDAPWRGKDSVLDPDAAYHAAGSSAVDEQLRPQPGGQAQVLSTFEPSGFQPAADWTHDPALDPNGLTGIWNDFLGTNQSTNNQWEQVFSELDFLSGGI